MKKKLLIEVGDDIDLDFIRKNCKTGGPIISPMPEFRAIADGKVLSDMTNGDVIKAMFPNAKVCEIFPLFNGDEVYYVSIEKVGDVTIEMRVMKSWWNAPYRETEVDK